MSATPGGGAMGKAAFRRGHGLWMVAVVLLAAGLLPACTDNSGPAGPRFPAGVTGSPDSGFSIVVTANPGTLELGTFSTITVVVTSAGPPGGRPIAGEKVNLTTTGGVLSDTEGITDAKGQFTTLLNFPCQLAGISQAIVTAFVRGIAGSSTQITIIGAEPRCGPVSP